jgi:uncharacterized protein YukE
MGRIEVQPGELTAAGGRQRATAGRLLEAASQLQVVAAGASSAAGEPGAAGAIDAWATAWVGAFGALAHSVGGIASNLDAAAQAYVVTDATAMPAGPR